MGNSTIDMKTIDFKDEAYAVRIRDTNKYCSGIRGYEPMFTTFNVFVSKTFSSKALAEVYIESIRNITPHYSNLEVCKVNVFCNIEK